MNFLLAGLAGFTLILSIGTILAINRVEYSFVTQQQIPKQSQTAVATSSSQGSVKEIGASGNIRNSNEFDPTTIKVGDTVGLFTVSNVAAVDERAPIGPLNMRITFVGHVTLTGTIEDNRESELVRGFFIRLSEESKSKIPYQKIDHNQYSYLILNPDLIEEGIRHGDMVEIVIRDYTDTAYPSEGADTINLRSIKKITE